MKRLWIALLVVVLFALPVRAQEGTVRLYLVPSEVYDPGGGTVYYGPLYFQWRFGTGTLPRLGQVHYGFIDGYIVLADLTQTDHDWLVTQPGAWAFPENLDANIEQADMEALRTRFEGFRIPTDWLTAANTYRELIHSTYGIFQFAKRYRVISGQYLFDAVTLETRYRDFPTDAATWFAQTVESFGWDAGFIRPNATMRQMLKTAGDYMAIPLVIGGYTF